MSNVRMDRLFERFIKENGDLVSRTEDASNYLFKLKRISWAVSLAVVLLIFISTAWIGKPWNSTFIVFAIIIGFVTKVIFHLSGRWARLLIDEYNQTWNNYVFINYPEEAKDWEEITGARRK